jgi:hypothetical protein
MEWLKNLIFKEDPNKDVKGATTPTTPAANQPALSNVQSADPTGVVQTNSVQGVLSDKILQKFSDVLDKANIPGQDYYEFRKSLDQMANLPMDEKTKFLSTYAVLSSQGCTKDVLRSSIDKYITVIGEERKTFTSELEKLSAQKVQSKLDAVAKAQKDLLDLQQKMSEVNTFIINTQQEAQQESLKLKTTEANFNVTADFVMNKLAEDKQKIEMYIPDATPAPAAK